MNDDDLREIAEEDRQDICAMIEISAAFWVAILYAVWRAFG